MGKVSFSKKEKSLEYIWNWYEDQRESLFDYKTKIIAPILRSGSNPNINKFSTFSLDEINQYFKESEDELERLVCFDVISATEAFLRIDFLKKVYSKDRSQIGRNFRDIHKKFGKKITLKENIIEEWKNFIPTERHIFSDFIGLLNYRDWLAHGRYWTPKLGRNYTFDDTYTIAERIFDIVK